MACAEPAIARINSQLATISPLSPIARETTERRRRERRPEREREPTRSCSLSAVARNSPMLAFGRYQLDSSSEIRLLSSCALGVAALGRRRRARRGGILGDQGAERGQRG